MLVFSFTVKSRPRHPKLHHPETVIAVGRGIAIEITRTKATSMAAQATGVLYLNKDTGTLAMLARRPTHGHLALMAINKADLINRAAATNITASPLSKIALLVARARRLRRGAMPVQLRSAR
jgi:hypothetical protein